MESGPDVSGAAPDVDNNASLANGHESLDLDADLEDGEGLDLGSGGEQHMHAVAEAQHAEDITAPSPSGPAFAAKSSTRRRTPTAAAVAANAQAAEAAPSKSKNARSRRKPADTSGVSRTSHGGVKIGGRAVTWVGGAGMPREVLDKMGIPQLRALFLKTFNHPTGSNNAEWLRKKLAQPRDPQVGAARAAVPRARDVGAEIWATGTTFKGFTKQERVKLQQMGGNCAAKVVEVIKDSPEDLAMKEKAFATKRRKKPIIDKTKMQIIGAEKFEMPPPKRQRAGEHNAPETGLPLGDPGAGGAQGSLDAEPFPGYATDMEPYAMTGQSGQGGAHILPQQQQAQQQWRTLELSDTASLRPGVSVKVYRADERWHSGVLENIVYKGSEMHVCIYYWEHDQSEERPISEFFRGENQSLIQWDASTPAMHQMTGMPISGVPMQGIPLQGVPMHGVPMQGFPIQGVPMQGLSSFTAVPASQGHDASEMMSQGNFFNGGVLRLQT